MIFPSSYSLSNELLSEMDVKIRILKEIRSLFKKLRNFKQKKTEKRELIPYSAFYSQCDFYCALLLGYPLFSSAKDSEMKWRRFNTINCQIISIIASSLCLTSFFVSIIDITNVDNLFIALENVTFFGILVIIFLEWYLILHRNYGKIKTIMAKLEEFYPNNIGDQMRFDTANYLKTIEKHSKYHIVVYTVLVIQFLSMPFLHHFYVYLWKTDSTWDFHINLNVSVDFTQQKLLWLKLAIDSWIIFGIYSVAAGTDLLFASLVHVTSMEINIVAQSINEINANEIDEMKELIKRHNSLIEIVRDLDDIFSDLLLFNFTAMLFSLTSTGFLAIVSKN